MIIAYRKYVRPARVLLRDVLFARDSSPFLRSWWEVFQCLRCWPRVASLLTIARLRIEYQMIHGFEPVGETEKRKWRDGMSRVLNTFAERSAAADTVIDVPDWFSLAGEEARNKIRQYFSALERNRDIADSGPETSTKYRFIARVAIPQVYVAPFSLLAGSLAQFNQDWGPIIADYEHTVKSSQRTFPRSDVQMFLFDCWLAWGPSIALCRCRRFAVQRGHAGPALQAGFGDENNSLPLLATAEKVNEIMRDEIREPQELPLASLRLEAELWSTGSYNRGVRSRPSSQNCPAQAGLFLREDPEPFLVYKNHGPVERAEGEESAYYYSAYLWILFLLVDEHGRVLTFADRPWRNALTFFEHGNLADPQTYEFMKGQLATKTARGLLELAGGSPFSRFVYACAIDHPGCGQELRYPYPGRKIHELVRDELGTRTWHDETREAYLNRIVLPDDDQFVAPHAELFSACHLPDLVRRFHDHVRMSPAAVVEG